MAKSKKSTVLRIKAKKASPGADVSARQFVERMKMHQSDAERMKLQKYFKPIDGEKKVTDKFFGIRMGQLFALAKEFIGMPTAEIEKLLESDIHEVRAGGMSIMDKQARDRKTDPSQRKELFELYLRRHDRINHWDLVDVAAQYVVGGYLSDKKRDVLYKLARSKNMWERRTAIVSTAFFIRRGDLDDAFKISEILVNDKQDLVNKATGWMLRFAGDKDKKRLLKFLDKYAASMPRTLLRYSIEKLDKKQRERYLSLGK